MNGDGERPKLRLIKTEGAKNRDKKNPKPKLPGPSEEGRRWSGQERSPDGTRRITPINSLRQELDALGMKMGSRIANVFKHGTVKITRGGQLVEVRIRCLEDLSEVTKNEMLTVRNMWVKSVEALEKVMERRGIRFKSEVSGRGGYWDR